MKYLLFIYTFLFSSVCYTATDVSIDELNLPYYDIKNIKFEESDRFFVLVNSISTNDKSLFPNIGQLILHTKSEKDSFKIKGTLMVTPEDDKRVLYYSLEDINIGQELDVLRASRFAMSICVLKMRLFDPKIHVNAKDGGRILIRILKNGLFSTYRNFEFKLSFEDNEWSAKFKRKRKYIKFEKIFLKAYKFGVKKVYFN